MVQDIPVKALRTTFRILDLLSKHDGMTFSEVTAELGGADSTVYDHLQSLRALRYVTKTDDRYRVSFEFLLFGDRRRSNNRLFTNAQAVVDELAETTGEHASLFVEEGGFGRTIYTKQGQNTVDFKVHDGSQSYLPFTAPGKAILASLPRTRVEELLNRQEPFGESNADAIARAELYDELDRSSERGFALDDQVAIEGMRGIAVPITDRDERVQGAISIYGPVRRLERESVHDSIVSALKTKKNVIELNLNYVDRS